MYLQRPHARAEALNCPLQGALILQTDPIGYEDDLNLYAYVRNDPLNLTDPTGRQTQEDRLAVRQCGVECGVALGSHGRTNPPAMTMTPEEGRNAALAVGGAFLGGAALGIVATEPGLIAAAAESPMVQGFASGVIIDAAGQISQGGDYDAGQTLRAGTLGMVTGGAMARTEGLVNQAVVGSGTTMSGFGFVNPDATLGEKIQGGLMGAATATARFFESIAVGIAENAMGGADEDDER